MESLKQPKIDVEKIQEVANKAAEKAYLEEIEDYYTSYKSPYRKMIHAELEKQKFEWSMSLPDILEKINSSLSKQIDIIANNAIASSYIPMVNDALIGMDKNITMEYFLRVIIGELEPEQDQYDDFHFNYHKDGGYDWLNCELSTPDNCYEFTLHHKEGNKYKLLSFPYNKYKTGYNSNMTIYKDDVKIEMPFTPGIIQDKVLKLFLKAMIGGSIIEMNCDSFNEDMFPEPEYCSC